MEIEWTDSRDGKTWRVGSYTTSTHLGGDRISFRHPPDLVASPEAVLEYYSVANGGGLRVDQLDDQEIKRLLDQGRLDRAR